MKKILLSLSLLVVVLIVNAQSPHAARLYGMTQYGGANKKGTIFHYIPETQSYTVDYVFKTKVKGKAPKCEIVTGNNGKYYGTTTAGGANNAGVLFELDSITNTYQELHDFTGLNGKDARGGMVLYNSKFYGMTNIGGANNDGVIYEWDITTNTYTKKIDLINSTGSNPTGSMIQINNLFYGFTSSGGLYNKGVLFEWNPATNVYTKKFDFDSIHGTNPVGKLAYYNGMFYGMCNIGGAFNQGVIYEWNYSTNTVTKKFDFDNIPSGAYPMGQLTLYNNKFYGTTYEGGIYQTTAQGQHFGIIFEYDPANNIFTKKVDLGDQYYSFGPLGSLTLKGNTFWGTTSEGLFSGGIFSWVPATNSFTDHYYQQGSGACEIDKISTGTASFESLCVSGDFLLGSSSAGAGNNEGCIYKYYPDSNEVTGVVTMLATDGSYPKGSLTKVGNKLYGLTFQGGNAHVGNIFEWNLNTQQFTERFQFDGYTTGTGPKGSLTYANGKLYGINTYGRSYKGTLGTGNTLASSWFTRDIGDLFSWDPSTNAYQSLALANYGRSTPTLFNNKLFFTTEVSSGSYPGGGGISAYDLSANSLTEVAALPMNFGTFNNYQSAVSTNGVTYYNGKFYGMTPAKYNSGAVPFRGTIYEWDTTTTVMSHKTDFVDSVGIYPLGNLLLVGNEFYGLASSLGNPLNTYPSLFKWNPATNILQKKASFNLMSFGTPCYSGGKLYFLSESSYADIYAYDPILDTSYTVHTEAIPLFGVGGGWNYTNCSRPPSYQQLLEVIPNQDPVLSNIPSTQTVCGNQIDVVTFTINDADLDTMNFQITSSNPGLIPLANISVSNLNTIYTITFSSIANQSGVTTLSFTANDGYGGTVSFSFAVHVNAIPNVAVTQNFPTLTSQQNAPSSYQWMDCATNMPITGETNQSFTVTTNGSYAVIINTGFCSDTSQCILVATVGLNKFVMRGYVTVFPNPANDFITVSKSNSDRIEIEILNILGKLIYKSSFTQQQTTIDLSNEAKGVYFVKTTDDNQNITNSKVIVQ